MSGRVIQGFFLSGKPKLPEAPVAPSAPQAAQAKAWARFPGPPPTAFAPRTGAVQAKAGPPAPAFAQKPPAVAQRFGGNDAFAVDPARLGLSSGGGRALPDAVRGKMEAAFGADFSSVRVHVGPQAERVGAIAFTLGQDIYFAPGRFQPDTVQGQQLLGHELAHVVQQRQGRVRNPLGSGVAVVQDRALEAEADRLGARAAAHTVALPALQRKANQAVRISAPMRTGPGSVRLTAGVGGRQVGSVMVHTRDTGVEVTDLGVDPAQRQHGIGRMLLASAARAGLQAGRTRVTLAAQDNGSGRLAQWYRGMGFTQTGVNKQGFPKLEAPVGALLAKTLQRMELKSQRDSDGDDPDRKYSQKNIISSTDIETMDLIKMQIASLDELIEFFKKWAQNKSNTNNDEYAVEITDIVYPILYDKSTLVGTIPINAEGEKTNLIKYLKFSSAKASCHNIHAGQMMVACNNLKSELKMELNRLRGT